MSDFSRTVPISQINYLEKHRIYDLFHEIARDLVIQQPYDHVMFIKEILSNAAKLVDKPKIIFIGVEINCEELAFACSKITKQCVITERIIINYMGKRNFEVLGPVNVAKAILHFVQRENGWIITCIYTEDQAKALVKAGIVPTHLIHIIPPSQPDLNELLYCNVSRSWPQKRRELIGIRTVFENCLRELYVGERSLDEVALECIEVSRRVKANIEIKPRVVLLGNPASEMQQAKLLESKLGLIHVDAAYLRNKYLYENRRVTLEKIPKLIDSIINRRILQNDCLRQGWVLTGFVDYNYSELFHYLELPPNRIIFFEGEMYKQYTKVPSYWKTKFAASYVKATETANSIHESIMAIITTTPTNFNIIKCPTDLK